MNLVARTTLGSSPLLPLCKHFLAAALIGTALCWSAPHGQAQAGLSDFTFVHASDIHAPMPQSKEIIANTENLGEINLPAFRTKVQKPEFAILTGDLNEFGGGNGSWKTVLNYWKKSGLPLYPQLGNHDNTWHCNLKALRDLGKGPYYSFDQHGCHFIGLMTATVQDPRPSIGEEAILWLKEDLKKVDPSTPVFVFYHHPLGGTEFASAYDCNRLTDVLRERHVVLMMAGHSHGHVHAKVEGLDQITGGSTFGRSPGFAVVSVRGGMLRAAYWNLTEPAPGMKLLAKSLVAPSSIPKIEITSPSFRGSAKKTLAIAARFSGSEQIQKASYSIDDEMTGDLTLGGESANWNATGTATLANLLPGAHYLRVSFERGAQKFSRSTQFFIDSPNTAWRAYLAASSKSTPTISAGTLYVGANDGRLHAFEAATGKALWSVDTGAEILAQPLVDDDRVVTANGLGVVSAFSREGKKLWSFTADEAVYSSPVLVKGKVIFGCNDGKLYALDSATGKQAWVNSDASYSIESKPFVTNGKVYYGAWDENIRCVDASNGKLLWKQASEGVRNARSAKRYYSPGDAMPVVAEGKLMVADRGYFLSILDADTGKVIGNKPQSVATGLSEDGKFVYLRKLNGDLIKLDSKGNEVWKAQARLGSAIPAAPTEKNGVVYACSAKGTVSAFNAQNGNLLWQYQASPQLYVMAAVACDDLNAYVVGFDGSLTAIKCKK